MKITISDECFKSKPSEAIIPRIKYVQKDLKLDEVENKIHEGYCLSANFHSTSSAITQSDRTYNNFDSVSYVAFDIDDDVDCTLDQLCDSLTIEPTIAYETFSHGIKGNRYRLLYFMSEPIMSIDDYKSIYSFISTANQLQLSDNCGRNCAQALFGTYSTSRVINTHEIYSAKELIGTKCHSKQKREREAIMLEWHFREDVDKGFLEDFMKFPTYKFERKYEHEYEVYYETPYDKDNTDASIAFIEKPTNYVLIKTPMGFTTTSSGKQVPCQRRLTYGEHRKKRLFTYAILRRFMLPTITFEHLLYSMVYDFNHFVDNSKNPIKKSQLLNIAKYAYSANLDDFKELYDKAHKVGFSVNNKYCEEKGITKKQAINIARKQRNYQMIDSVFDINRTDKENIELIYEKTGKKVSLRTLKRYRKERGFTKYKKVKHACADCILYMQWQIHKMAV